MTHGLMKSLSILLVALALFPKLLWGNTIFEKMVEEFAKQGIEEFVGYMAKNQRYPLLHTITRLRLQIFQAYLGIAQARDTKPCSNRRNFGSAVPPNRKEFCRQYDDTIEAAKWGVADLDAFETAYFQLEPFLLQEIEIQQARDPMKRWIGRKLNCLNDKTRCGRDERGLITRVTDWEPNIIRLYKHLLTNLEKKLFPEEGSVVFFNEEVIESPCSASAEVEGTLIEHGMVFIPEGTFIMGSNKGRPDEKKAHAVFLDEYWIDRCEVTNFQFLKYLNTDPSLRKSTFQRHFHDGEYLKNWISDLTPPTGRDNYPVTYVSWFAARYYCQSIGKRLPSEAEWERASRAGSLEEYPLNDPSRLGDYAWYNQNSEGEVHLVADRRPNKFQLFDMQGNLWEWVYDWYAPYPQGRANNPQGPSLGKYRVIRGGSWKSPASHLRSTMRGDDSPINTSAEIGFRCAASDPPEPLP